MEVRNTAPTALGRLEDALARVAGAPVSLERPGNPEHGDYATNVALRLAGAQKRAPLEIAAELAEAATAIPGIERRGDRAAGFLNLWLAPSWFGEALGEIVAAGARLRRRLGRGARARSRSRWSRRTRPARSRSPRARNGAYGDSVARLLAFAGHEVEREYYYNDAGAQMDRFRASVEARPTRRAAARGRLQRRVHRGARTGSTATRSRTCSARSRRASSASASTSTPGRCRASSPPTCPSSSSALDTYERDGALWVRSTAFGDEKDRVLIRSAERGGLPTYEAADIVYLRDKLERGFDRAIYVLGADHHGVRGWYRVIAQMLGYDPERVEVILYQLVHLTRGGDVVKMSKRRGDVVTLDEFMDEVGVDAARWYLAARGPDQAITIDVDLAREKSEKNPVYYVQYAHARIGGILLRRGRARGERRGAVRARRPRSATS